MMVYDSNRDGTKEHRSDGKNFMPLLMKLFAAASSLAAVCAALLYVFTRGDVWFTLAVTFGTTAYHFWMRLLVGLLFNGIMKNKADYTKKWFQVSPFEQRIYKILRVKKWKGKMPTYNPETFDPALHSWDEIAQAMCQSELGHETIILLSFAPIIASVWAGALTAFLITSAVSAMLDLVFVIMQRYNRPRVVRLLNKQKAERKNEPKP